jgi:parallel beta-helix repeat protein
MKKFALEFILLLVLCSVLVSLPQINIVKASGTIYIRADGSVEGAGLTFEDGVYVFTGDIYGQIIIEKDGVIIDSSGYVLHGMDEGGVFLENRSDVVLRDIEVVDAPFGITMVDGRNNQITESKCSIYLENSFNNAVFGNERISLFFSNSSENIVKENKLTDNTRYGFKLQKSSNENNIFRNKITDSRGGIEFHGNSSNNNIYENRIVNNADGIIIFQSYNNSFHDNLIAYNSNYGIFFEGSEKNIFFRNNIVENAHQTGAWLAGGNIWDNSSVGNYWSNYKGTDNDGDGIGDQPYYVPTVIFSTGEGYDVDNYPLMEPVIIPKTQQSEPFPKILIVIAIVIVAVAGVSFLAYLRKIRKTTGKAEIISEGVM